MDSQRALLDQLMGRNRDLPPDEHKRLKWNDPEVCQHFVVDMCPHELFTNTKSDLGVCKKEHDPKLRAVYQQESDRVKLQAEGRYLRFLEGLVDDIDKRIRKGNERLNLTAVEDPEEKTKREEKVTKLNDQIKTLLAQMEKLGDEGRVDESQSLLNLVEGLKKEKTELEMPQGMQAPPDMRIAKSMHVCEVCGAFLVVGDAEQRVQAHLIGKQHKGFVEVREKIEKLKKRQIEYYSNLQIKSGGGSENKQETSTGNGSNAVPGSSSNAQADTSNSNSASTPSSVSTAQSAATNDRERSPYRSGNRRGGYHRGGGYRRDNQNRHRDRDRRRDRTRSRSRSRDRRRSRGRSTSRSRSRSRDRSRKDRRSKSRSRSRSKDRRR